MQIFITGVSSGVGRELAKFLVASGHTVWGVARRKQLLEQLNLDLNSDKFFYSQCDLADPQAVESVITQMRENNFFPEAVILNAGVLKPDTDKNFDIEAAEQVLKINFDANLQLIAEFFKFREVPKQFIAVSSIFALRPDVTAVSYAASKAALSMAFRSLRLKYAPRIAFKIIYFGPIQTAINPRTVQYKQNSVFSATAQRAARKISSVLDSPKQDFYFPFWATLAVRATMFLPDGIFHKFTNPFRR